MTVLERLQGMVDVLPDEATVQLRIRDVREWLCGSAPRVDRSEGPEDYTLPVLSVMLGRAESTLRAWCAAGRFHGAYRFNGKEWRVPPASFESFVARQRHVEAVTTEPVHATARGPARLSDAWESI